MEQEKKCKNCKYFITHYVKDGTYLLTLSKGHCTNDEIPWKTRKNGVQDKHCCEKWESNADLKFIEKESIKTVLKNMRQTLINIEKFLSDGL